MKRICKVCKKEFITYPSRTKRKYCSKECYLKDWHNNHPISWNKGKKLHYPVWNKGTKGVCKPNSGSFKKGHKSRHNNGFNFNRGRWVVVGRDNSKTAFSRVVMQNELNREILTSEIVHHINGDPTDDRIENLEIVTRADHVRIHKPKLGVRVEKRLSNKNSNERGNNVKGKRTRS